MGKAKKSSGRRKEKKAVASPRNLVTIERVLGSANFGDQHHEDAAHVQPSIRPAQLPARDGEFTGRQRELIQIARDLERGGAVALFGPPGVGKTALAVHVAHSLIEDFTDAQLYVDLNGAGGQSVDIERVLEGFLRALGFSGDEIAKDLAEKSAQYRSALYGRRSIIVIDNAANEGQVRDLLPGTSECVVLITSRHSLGGLAGVRRHRIGTLDSADSVSLLTEVIGIERVESDLISAENICTLCGGLPLALRITANRLRDRPHWGLSYYAEKLSDERRRLELLRSGDLEVRASFALSYAELSEEEQRVFRVLGTTSPAGFGVQVVAHLFQVDELDAELMLDELVEKSLLLLSPTPGRYQMHDLIRVFALERLYEEEGEQAVSQLVEHLTLWFGFMADGADRAIFGRDARSGKAEFASPEKATDWLEAEHLALVDTVQAAYERQMYAEVMYIASSLSRFFERRLHGNSWRKVADYELDSARALGGKESIINAIIGYVRMSDKVASEPEGESTVALLDEAYELARDLGSPRYEAAVLYQIGCAAHRKKNYAEAKRILSRSVSLASRSKSRHQEGNALLALSDALSELGEKGDAESCSEKARLLFVMQRDRHCEGNSWKRLGLLRLEQGDATKAVELFKMAMRRYEDVYDLHCAGMAGLDAARAFLASSDFINSRLYCQQAYEKFRRINDISCGCVSLAMLARFDRRAGDYQAAIAKYEKVCEALKNHGTRSALAHNLKLLGETVEEYSGREAAFPYLEQALAAARGIDEGLAHQIRCALEASSPASLPEAGG